MTSLSKWSPGGHIGFFGFQTLTLVWFWISTPNKSGTILMMYMGRSLLIFSIVNIKMATRWNFFGFRTLTLVWLWISTPNLSVTILIYMGRSLLIFSDVTFKMAVWRPYWIFLVSGLTLVWLWISTPKDFQWPHFLNGCLVAILDFSVSGRQA